MVKTRQVLHVYLLLVWVSLFRSSQRVVQMILVAVDSASAWTLALKEHHLMKAAGRSGHLAVWTLWFLMYINEGA